MDFTLCAVSAFHVNGLRIRGEDQEPIFVQLADDFASRSYFERTEFLDCVEILDVKGTSTSVIQLFAENSMLFTNIN